jgi:hypothetical protein
MPPPTCAVSVELPSGRRERSPDRADIGVGAREDGQSGIYFRPPIHASTASGMRSAFAKPGGAEAAAVTATRLEMRITISRLKGVNAQIPALHRLPKPPLGPRRRAHAARASPQTSAAVVRTLGIPQRQAWIIIIVVLLHAWSSLLAATRLRSGLGWPNGFCKGKW